MEWDASLNGSIPLRYIGCDEHLMDGSFSLVESKQREDYKTAL